MAFGTVARSVDEVSAAIPLRGLGRIGDERLAVEKQQLPETDGAANVEWKRHIVVADFSGHRRQSFQVGEEIAQVVKIHALIRSVGKSRKQVLASGRSSPDHGGHELRLAPGANAVAPVRGNIRNVEGAERRT